MGRRKRPVFAVVAADERSPRDGRFIEDLGRYNPIMEPAEVELNEERVLYWLKQGAQPSETVRSLLSREGLLVALHGWRKGKSDDEIQAEVEKHRSAVAERAGESKLTPAARRQAALAEEKKRVAEAEAEEARQQAEAEAARKREEEEARKQAAEEAKAKAEAEKAARAEAAKAEAAKAEAEKTEATTAQTADEAKAEDAGAEPEVKKEDEVPAAAGVDTSESTTEEGAEPEVKKAEKAAATEPEKGEDA